MRFLAALLLWLAMAYPVRGDMVAYPLRPEQCRIIENLLCEYYLTTKLRVISGWARWDRKDYFRYEVVVDMIPDIWTDLGFDGKFKKIVVIQTKFGFLIRPEPLSTGDGYRMFRRPM